MIKWDVVLDAWGAFLTFGIIIAVPLFILIVTAIIFDKLIIWYVKKEERKPE
jgi:surface polysaccharide O-acyltransferase-like enzyme